MMRVCMLYTCMYVNAHVRVESLVGDRMRVCMLYVCMYVCMHVCKRTCTGWTHDACLHVVQLYVCMHVWYVYMQTITKWPVLFFDT